jgi:hypothetical protein
LKGFLPLLCCKSSGGFVFGGLLPRLGRGFWSGVGLGAWT